MGFSIEARNPALELFVTIVHAWVISNANCALLISKHVELRAVSLQSCPAFWQVSETKNEIKVQLDLIKRRLVKDLIHTQKFPSLVQIAGVIHVATIALTSLDVAVNVLVLKTLNLRTVVGNEVNRALLFLARDTFLTLVAIGPEVVELLAWPGFIKKLIALWLVNFIVKRKPGVILVPERLGGEVICHLIAVYLFVGPLALNSIIKGTYSVIIIISAALFLHYVVALLWGDAQLTGECERLALAPEVVSVSASNLRHGANAILEVVELLLE